MSIAPIVRTVETKAPPERAFELFSQRMADWWQRGKTIGKNPHDKVILEPRVGGRWYEIDAEGAETEWGKVLAYEPPHRLLLAWQIGANWAYDPEFTTEVELTFEALSSGGTRLTLEHRNLERFGANAAQHAALLDGGWPTMLADFATLGDAEG